MGSPGARLGPHLPCARAVHSATSPIRRLPDFRVLRSLTNMSHSGLGRLEHKFQRELQNARIRSRQDLAKRRIRYGSVYAGVIQTILG